ncbi:MAG: hypothetical protein WEE89_09460 [Gemmatimonadota bacterium]
MSAAIKKESLLSKTFLKELVAFIGVVGSLIFVGVQIRQNTMAARASAYQEMGALLSDIWLNTAQDSGRAMLTLKFFLEDSATFTPAEEAVLINQSIGAFRQMEATWRQVELGLLEPDVLEAFGWNRAETPAFTLHMRQLWPRIGPLLSQDFRNVVEAQFGWK